MSLWSEFTDGVRADYGVGRDDRAKMFYAERNRRKLDDDAPRLVNMAATHPVAYRSRELLGIANPDAMEARREIGMGLKPTAAGRAGQLVGSLGADLTQDVSRSWWWLMNAAQASANVVNETTLGMVNPDLYGATRIDVDYNDLEALERAGLAQKNTAGELERKPGVFSAGQGKTGKRNYRSGYVTALGIPTGLAINNALGLLTPTGGAEGYEAAIPSLEDPSKTDNVIAEVGTKYLLGRTGGLLPYHDFIKQRPDVDRDQYHSYKAFKYDKKIDLDPSDGDITLPAGVLKLTDEGIHGPEMQFLGRSLPLTTAGVPFATALLGGALGVRKGRKFRQSGTVDPNAVKRGFAGGMAGALGGIALGNLLESERRRRNMRENEQKTVALDPESTAIGF